MNFFRKLFGQKPATPPASTPPPAAPADASTSPATQSPVQPATPTPPPAPVTPPTPPEASPLAAFVNPPAPPRPAPAAPPQITLLTVEGPVWLPGDSPAAELFPVKPDDAPIIAFLGGSAELDPAQAKQNPQIGAVAAKLARAVPLYLADAVEFGSTALTRNLVAWVVKPRPGFILGGAPWDDATASRHARSAAADAPADFLVVCHLRCREQPWSMELRVVRTIDAACLATLSAPFSPNDPIAALPGLTRDLLAQLATHAHASATPETAATLPAASAPYLLQLEQLLTIRTAGIDPDNSPLPAPRDLLEAQLRFCRENPASVPARLIFAHGLRGMQRLRPELVDEYRAAAEALQSEHPLTEPAQAVLSRVFAETFVD
jgi:hypothetical protein